MICLEQQTHSTNMAPTSAAVHSRLLRKWSVLFLAFYVVW